MGGERRMMRRIVMIQAPRNAPVCELCVGKTWPQWKACKTVATGFGMDRDVVLFV